MIAVPTATKTKKATAKKSPTVHVTLGTFDSHAGSPTLRVLRTSAIGRFKDVTRADYNPRGGTPLRDATADFIHHLDSLRKPDRVIVGMLADESGSMGGNEEAVVSGFNDFVAGLTEVEVVDPESAGQVLCVIFTDGHENTSNRYSPQALQSLVGEREADGFTFIYLGANVDAWNTGSSMGIRGTAHAHTVNYVSSPVGTANAMKETTARSASFLSSSAGFVGEYGSLGVSSLSEDGSLLAGNSGAAGAQSAPSHQGGSVPGLVLPTPIPPTPPVERSDEIKSAIESLAKKGKK